MIDKHTYTFSHDTKRIHQMESDTYTPQAGDMGYIKDDAEPLQSKMNSHIDNILQILADIPKPEDPKSK